MNEEGTKDIPSKIQDQLNIADLRLKRLGWWVSLIGIMSAVTALFTTYSTIKLNQEQRILTSAQALEQVEKQRVSFRFKVMPILLPNRKQFYLKVKLKNYSVKQLNIFLIALRVWRGGGWDDSDYNVNVSDDSQDILVSDILIADCPDIFCQEKAQGGLQLRKLESNLSIEATEQESEHSFGPYNITEKQGRSGIWVEGIAYVRETGQGQCMLNPKGKFSRGDIPRLCEKRGETILCSAPGSCVSANSSPEFFSLSPGVQEKQAVFKSAQSW